MPGDELAASEEYMPGPGTYEREGVVYAAVLGRAVYSEEDKTVSVQALRPVSSVRRGDLVLGEVTAVTASLVTVHITGIEEAADIAECDGVGVIHVSKVRDAYIDDARKEYRVGDLLRAEVLQASPSLQLSTKDDGLGVLKALCPKCRAMLCNRSGSLHCAECERDERRKLASDFAAFTPHHAGDGK